MSRVGRYENPYLSHAFLGEPPSGSSCELLGLQTQDRAACHAALWLPAGKRARTAVMVMHPRADFLRHYAVPRLLDAGYAVLAQNSRSVGNDSMLVHERVLLDVAAGVRALRARGFERVVALGNSGGGSLYTFYGAQAAARGTRLTDTAAGDPLALDRYEMPAFDALVLLAAHPGEGEFLAHCIDPSVIDENDPLACDPALDMYDARNGFRTPPEPTRYEPAFVERYRAAQKARIARIDARAHALVAARRAAQQRAAGGASQGASSESVGDMRGAVAVPFLNVYRTDADPRAVDLGLDPSDRDYGSLFGRRPDVINYGPFGFARTVTPDAWLSTWSASASRASIARNGPQTTVPAFVISYTGDNAVFPSETQAIYGALGSADKEMATVRGDHYGHLLAGDGDGGRDAALDEIAAWMKKRGF